MSFKYSSEITIPPSRHFVFSPFNNKLMVLFGCLTVKLKFGVMILTPYMSTLKKAKSVAKIHSLKPTATIDNLYLSNSTRSL